METDEPGRVGLASPDSIPNLSGPALGCIDVKYTLFRWFFSTKLQTQSASIDADFETEYFFSIFHLFSRSTRLQRFCPLHTQYVQLCVSSRNVSVIFSSDFGKLYNSVNSLKNSSFTNIRHFWSTISRDFAGIVGRPR